MATRFCASEITFDDTEVQLALFSDDASCNAMEDFCNSHLAYSLTAKKVILTDLDLGIDVYKVCHDEEDFEDFDEPADLEMGFDPYIGGYSYDC